MKLARLLFGAKTAIFRTLPLIRDTRVPVSLKLVAAAIGLLIVSPVDVFSDVPRARRSRRCSILALLCMWFVRQASKHVEHDVTRRRPGDALAAR